MLKRAAVVVLSFLVPACAETGEVMDPELTPRFAATVTTTNERIPFDLVVFVPCADSGSGEEVALSGSLHVLTHITINDRGGISGKSHFQPQGITGTGSVTGVRYQGTGGTQERFTTNAGDTYSFVNNFRIVGQGPGNDFAVHQNVHVTVDAKGNVRTEIDNVRTTCR